MGKRLIILSFLFLTACTTGSVENTYIEKWCASNGPHRFTDETMRVMSIKSIRRELLHNQTGAKWCGWRK